MTFSASKELQRTDRNKIIIAFGECFRGRDFKMYETRSE